MSETSSTDETMSTGGAPGTGDTSSTGEQATPRDDTTWHSRHKATLSSGQRAADIIRNGMGSWQFVGGFIAFMAAWAALNSVALASQAWDPYPYILLNLFLSMLAGLQGAILLIAAKRQDAIAAAMAQHDYDTDVRAEAEIEQLMAINQKQLEILRELRALSEARANKAGDAVANPPDLLQE